jgi:hypothetical protein
LDFQGGKTAQIFDFQTGLPAGGKAAQLANPTVTKPREGQLALKLIW